MGFVPVKSKTLTASGAVTAGRGRVRGLYIMSGATAGSVIIKNGGASGVTVLDIATPASATVPIYIDLPGSGIVCETDIYCTISVATSVAVMYD